jgi:hypothetical protein
MLLEAISNGTRNLEAWHCRIQGEVPGALLWRCVLMNRLHGVGVGVVLAVGLSLVPTSVAFATANPSGHGQPSQSCGSDTAPNSPNGFNTAGFAHAELVYAGSAPQNSNNPKSVSQYDVACFQVSQH